MQASTESPSPAPREATSAPGRGLAWLQLVLGLGLLVYLARHVVEQWSALSGPEAWVLRAAHPGSATGVLMGGLAFALYGGLGLALAWQPAAPRSPMSRPRLVTGVLGLAFVAVHMAQVWPPAPGPHASAWASYQRLLESAGLPWSVVANVLGLTAVCVHVALGLEWAACVAARHPVSGTGLRALRYVSGLACMLAWGALLHLFGHYAIGDGLVPTGERLDSVAPREGAPIRLGPTAK